ncbi:MAG: transcriptional regulator [Clostridiales bacterium]|nr:transcriptional regulator [Clostridiales bacterium]
MKMILAIVSKDDSSAVSSTLTREGYWVTKLATTGGFLMAGNTTFLIGTDDDRVNDVIAIVEKQSRKRTQMVPGAAYGAAEYSPCPTEITVGGATIFVLDVERFEKV